MTKHKQTATGKVYLVGAGPGAPGLITLRGVQCLERADVVLYDYLVNSRILQHAPSTAERICLGQHGRTRLWSQAEIDAVMVESARAGKTVVRLKGGDPAVFARGAEEVEVLCRHGIEFEVVPGITAALAAGSYAGVPITHRDYASAVAIVTGQETDGKVGLTLDYGKLAQFPGTLVVYMGVTTAPQWTAALLQAGMTPEMPAIIIRRCSFPDQTTVRCTLSQITNHLVPATKLRPPVIVILGRVAALSPEMSWFERRPLFGQTVLVTRPEHQAGELAERLEECGAHVLFQPAIVVREPRDWVGVDNALAQLNTCDWLVFSSVNGVHALLGRLAATGRDLRAWPAYAWRPLARRPRRRWRNTICAPISNRSGTRPRTWPTALLPEAAGKRFLLARQSRSRSAGRASAGCRWNGRASCGVRERRRRNTGGGRGAAAAGRPPGLDDGYQFGNRAIAGGMFGDDLKKTRLVSISPVTSATLRELGLEPAAEAAEATVAGVVDVLCHR